LLKQRVFSLIQGYEDANYVVHLKNDPLFKDVLECEMASQPTLSRFENSVDKRAIFELSYACVERYIDSLKGRKCIIIDVDATDDPTYGQQQLSIFNGYYASLCITSCSFMMGIRVRLLRWYFVPVIATPINRMFPFSNELLKKSGPDTRNSRLPSELIVASVALPFTNSPIKYELRYAIGMASNEVLKRRVVRASNAVEKLYVANNIKHQHFISFSYQAGSWHKSQQCFSKIDSTCKGLNIRHVVSNIEEKEARDIYFNFYVKRGEASENRIKEVKNMCYSDRLSNHGFWANILRLLIRSMAYEIFLLIKKAIRKTGFEPAKKWQISTIRTLLLKLGATIKITKRRIYYQLSKAFVHQGLFRQLIFQ